LKIIHWFHFTFCPKLGDDISWGNAGNRDKKSRKEDWAWDSEEESEEEDGIKPEAPLSNTRKLSDTVPNIEATSTSSAEEESGEHSPKRQRICMEDAETDETQMVPDLPGAAAEVVENPSEVPSSTSRVRKMFQPPPRYISQPYIYKYMYYFTCICAVLFIVVWLTVFLNTIFIEQ
jgi:hypothetical protein